LKRGNTIEFNDSYGIKPDEQSDWVSKNKLKEFRQDTHYLTELLKNSGYRIVYNKYPFQSSKHDISTCGRHAATRLYFKHLSLPEYAQMVLDSGMAPDDFVTSFTQKLIHH
jgi:predicted secreted protein